MMVDRLIAPRSKLGFVRAVDEETAASSLGAVLRLGQVKEREAYEALDWLVERQARIENGLARRHLEDGVLVLYDVSSSYFEGRCCPLAHYGHSRDHRGDRPQTATACCARARPAGRRGSVRWQHGRSLDAERAGREVKDRFGMSRLVLVGDRGMITAARIRDDLRPAGLDWITCLRAPAIQALAADDGPLQLSLFDDRDWRKSAPPRCSRASGCRVPNRDLTAERARKRDELLAATERELAASRRGSGARGRVACGAPPRSAWRSAPCSTAGKSPSTSMAIGDGSLTWRRRIAHIEEEARLDGIYVIRKTCRRTRSTRRPPCGPIKAGPRRYRPDMATLKIQGCGGRRRFQRRQAA